MMNMENEYDVIPDTPPVEKDVSVQLIYVRISIPEINMQVNY